MPVYVGIYTRRTTNLAAQAPIPQNAISYPAVCSPFADVSWKNAATKRRNASFCRYTTKDGRWTDAQTRMGWAGDSRHPVFVHCIQPGCGGRAVTGNHRQRQGADGSWRLRQLPYRRSRKTFCRGKADRDALRRHLFRQPDARPQYRARPLERRGLPACDALRREARRGELLPGLPLPAFHQTDPRRYPRDPRLSRHTLAGRKYTARAGATLAAELSCADAVVEFCLLPAGYFRARPEQERGVESRRLSGRGSRALRRLPYAEKLSRRRQAKRAICRQRGRRLVCAAPRWGDARWLEIVERRGYRRISRERAQRPQPCRWADGAGGAQFHLAYERCRRSRHRGLFEGNSTQRAGSGRDRAVANADGRWRETL